MRAYECAGQREKITLITSYYTVFSICPIFSTGTAEDIKRALHFQAAHHSSPLTFQRRKKRVVLQREIKASNFWDLLPDGTPDTNTPTHHNTCRIYSDHQQHWCVLCAGTHSDNIGRPSQKFKPCLCILSNMRCNAHPRASYQEVNFSLPSVHAGFIRTIPLLLELQEQDSKPWQLQTLWLSGVG